jgi:hypothetical protein
LLESEGLARVDEAHRGGEVAQSVHIFVRGKSDNFHYELVDFAERNCIRLSKPLVTLDFGDF